MKKIISALLAAALLVSAVPFAFAEGTGVYVAVQYDSKICEESYPLNRGPGVGAGDRITLFVSSSVPVVAALDGETLAELPAGDPAETAFSVGAEGDHTLSFTAEGEVKETIDFHVYSQKEVYRRQLKDAADDVENPLLLLLTPLLALPLTVIAPPLGIAAFSVPVMGLMQVFYVIECAFRFVNLLRK